MKSHKDLWIRELVTFTRRGFAVVCAESRTSGVQAVVDYYGPMDFSQMGKSPTDSDHDAPGSWERGMRPTRLSSRL